MAATDPLTTKESTQDTPCNCNRAVLCFIPALLWVLLLGEFFLLLTRIFVRFYSEQFYNKDFTQSSVWTAVSPFVAGLWGIFWAIVTQSGPTSKSSTLAKFALIDVKNMFPELLPSSNNSSSSAGSAKSDAKIAWDPVP